MDDHKEDDGACYKSTVIFHQRIIEKGMLSMVFSKFEISKWYDGNPID